MAEIKTIQDQMGLAKKSPKVKKQREAKNEPETVKNSREFAFATFTIVVSLYFGETPLVGLGARASGSPRLGVISGAGTEKPYFGFAFDML